MTNISDLVDHSDGWDWEENHVTGSFSDIEGGTEDISISDIVEAGTVLIAAGPADLDSALGTARGAPAIGDAEAVAPSLTGIRIVPIGLVETAQINMNKPLSRIFEIGSKLSYIIPGRTVGGIALNRVFFDGPSLLKMLYAGEVTSDSATSTKKNTTFTSGAIAGVNQETAHIGSGNLAMNLASSFFEQPIGLAFYFQDQSKDVVSQIYFEGCQVTTYNMGISANMNVLTESVNMEFVRCRPIVVADSNTSDTRLIDKNIVSSVTTTTTPAG